MCADLLTNAQHCNGAQIQTLLFARPIPVGTSMGAHSPKYTFGRMWTRRPACVFKPPKPMTCSHVSPLHAALLAVPPDKTPGWFCFRLPSSEITQKLFPTSSLQTLGYFFLSASGGTKPPRAGAGCFFPGCFQGGRRAELGCGTRCSYLGSLPIPGTTLQLVASCSSLLPAIAACRCRGMGTRIHTPEGRAAGRCERERAVPSCGDRPLAGNANATALPAAPLSSRTSQFPGAVSRGGTHSGAVPPEPRTEPRTEPGRALRSPRRLLRAGACFEQRWGKRRWQIESTSNPPQHQRFLPAGRAGTGAVPNRAPAVPAAAARGRRSPPRAAPREPRAPRGSLMTGVVNDGVNVFSRRFPNKVC